MQKIAILFFCLLISLPLLLFAFGMHGGNVDNRAAREIPAVTWQGLTSGKWFAGINAYLIDSVPLRDRLIRLNAQLNHRAFGAIESDKVSLGHDGWLFYNGALDAPCIAPSKIETHLRALTTIAQRYHAQHGTRIVWVIVPNKSSVYPEKLTPLQTKRSACMAQNRSAIRRLLQDSVYAPYIHGQWDVMERHKQDGQLYFSYDTHWNNLGILAGLTAMFDAIWPDHFDPAQIILQDADGNLNKGDLAAMAGLVMEEPFPVMAAEKPHGHPAPERETCIAHGGKATKHALNISNHPQNPLIPEKVVIIHDSFLQIPMNFIASYFAQVDFSHYKYTPQADFPAIAACADTMVIHTVERSFLARAAEFANTMNAH